MEKVKVLFEPTPIDWSKIPVGSKFEGSIEGRIVEGRIQKENEEIIYLCQNKMDGCSTSNKLGFRYSWQIGDGGLEIMKEQDVIIIKITSDPTFSLEKPIKIGDNTVIFNRGSIKVGCTTVKNSVVLEIAKKLKK